MESNKLTFTDILSQLVLVIAVSVLFLLWLRKRRKLNLPPGPKGYPVVGCSPMLGENAHLTLQKWAREYGDVYGLYLGGAYVVVVSDPVLAKELFNQSANLDRPSNLFQFMPHGVGVGDINGPEWSEQRRFTMREMKNIGLGRNVWDNLLQAEAQHFVKYLEDFKGQPVDYTFHLSSSFSSNIMSFVTGRQLSSEGAGRQILLDGTESFTFLHAPSGLKLIFPNLFKFAASLGLTRLAPHFRNLWNLSKFIQKEVETNKKEETDRQTYITGYMKEMKDANRKGNNFFNERNLLGNVQGLIVAGTDTTLMSLRWLLLAMATHPEVQEKVHNELDSVLGHSDEPISYLKDRNRFPYCCATIDEGQRWRTVVPLNVYHKCNTDIKIKEYDVPAGSYLIGFLWAFHNNPHFWPEPDRFKPERFLGESGNVNKDRFSPFSMGKRKCPGELVAYMEIFIYFTSIMRKFKVELPEQDTKFDLQGILSLTLKPKPHKLQFVLRGKI